jgi:YibE/F-like protein
MAATGNPSRGARRGSRHRLFELLVAAIGVGTIIGLVALWPGDVDAPLAEGLAADTERAEVISVTYKACPAPQTGQCGEAQVGLETGPEAGETVTLPVGGGTLEPELEPGDEIRVARTEPAPVEPPASGEPPAAPNRDEPAGPTAGTQPGLPAQGDPTYTLTDFERRAPILWLALGFAALVIAFGRLRGALSLLGLGISLAVILAFIVPAILDGSPPLVVAVIGSLAVMLATVSLAHGWGPKSLAAMLGTAVSLGLVAGLALAFTNLAHLTGLSSEEATLLLQSGADVSLEGLLLAGIVIAALGVLDDVTVSQASTVLELRAADPAQGFRRLYGRALRVGRDHVSATVNTLVLAYVGASLPVLLIFSSGEIGLIDAINTELIAKEVVGTLVGSIGLIAAVPVTTALAALLASDLPAEPPGSTP